MQFVPLSVQSVLANPLTCMYDESCTKFNLEYNDLLVKFRNIIILSVLWVGVLEISVPILGEMRYSQLKTQLQKSLPTSDRK